MTDVGNLPEKKNRVSVSFTRSGRYLFRGALLTFGILASVSGFSEAAQARTYRHAPARHHSVSDMLSSGRHHHYRKHHQAHVIQCVAYVHSASDFRIHGDAKWWWSRAEGLYARGQIPEPDAVLAFKPIRRMKLGHVAIVNRVLGPRLITINQAHWGENRIVHDVRVIDVSKRNDWTMVRVELAHNPGHYGNNYPTHGFIYHRPVGSHALPRDVAYSDIETVNVNDETSLVPEQQTSDDRRAARVFEASYFDGEKPPASML